MKTRGHRTRCCTLNSSIYTKFDRKCKKSYTSSAHFLIMAVAKSSSWRMEDLQDLEQYGLAAELESTNLEGPAEAAGARGQTERDFGAYNMT